jgi:hypothetical protein
MRDRFLQATSLSKESVNKYLEHQQLEHHSQVNDFSKMLSGHRNLRVIVCLVVGSINQIHMHTKPAPKRCPSLSSTQKVAKKGGCQTSANVR